MLDVFQNLRHVEKTKNAILLDSCFFLNLFENHKQYMLSEFISNNNVCLTSFNAAEILHRLNRFDEKVFHNISHFLFSSPNITILDINVYPGNKTAEVNYVTEIGPELLNIIPDPSDAVLAACAIKFNSDIITKDRHHLYTNDLKHFFEKHNLEVYDDFFEK